MCRRRIAADAGNALIGRNLSQQRQQDRRVSNAVIGHFHGPDLERQRINTKVHLAPLAAVVRAMLFRLPFAFAQHLDTDAVHQQMQTRRGRYGADGDLQRFLAATDPAVARYRLAQPSQMQQTLRHTHGLAQR